MKKLLSLAILCAAAWVPATLAAADDVRENLVSYWPLDSLEISGPNFVSPDLITGNDFVSGGGMLLEDLVNDPERGNVLYVADSIEGVTVQSYMYFFSPSDQDTGLPISMNPSWTAMFWVKASYPIEGQNDRRVFSESSSLNTGPLINVGTHNGGADGTVDLYFRNGNTQLNHVHSPTTAYDDTWRHIAVVVEPGTAKLYIDGALDLTEAYTPGTLPSDITSIGAIVRGTAFDNLAAFFTGYIDDVALWERALTEAEVQEVIANGIQTPVPTTPPVITVQPAGSELIFGDSWTLSVRATGTHPMNFQWKKDEVDIAGATSKTYNLVDAQPADSGSYTCVVSNGAGTETSEAAAITVTDWPEPDLLDGMLCYWPLDEVVGTKTPDIRSWYDMELVNLSEADLVAGRWGNCFQFTGANSTLLQRINQPGVDELCIYPYPSFTISLWVNGGLQNDMRVFSEGSTESSSPLFNIGTHNGGADGTVDTYIRTDTGATDGGHRLTEGSAFDETWHHIIYSQRTLAGELSATIYIDGVADPNPVGPVRPLSVNTTTIGGIRRGAPSHWFTGLIDDVALWTRALSPEEATLLYSSGTPIPEQRLRPLQISSFSSDFPAAKVGDPVQLSWDVSSDATVTIEPGVGDVTDQTVAGVGSVIVNVDTTTTYTLTISREGGEEVSAQVTVGAVSGISDNWSLLDNFEQYALGTLGDAGYWLDLRASGLIVDAGGNKMLEMPEDPDLGDAAALLPLSRLTIMEGDRRTLFFRALTGDSVDILLRHHVGVTDKNLRWHTDSDESGPMLIVQASGDGTPMQVGTRQNVGGADEWHPEVTASPNTLYNVWIDITNDPFAPGDPPADTGVTFSIYIQADGDAERITLWEGYLSNRNPEGSPELGPALPDLDKLFVTGVELATLRFDDFYISNAGFNSTVPRAVSEEGVTVEFSYDGGDLTVTWTSGTLESADTIGGSYAPVAGAAAPSHTITPGDGQLYFRVRN